MVCWKVFVGGNGDYSEELATMFNLTAYTDRLYSYELRIGELIALVETLTSRLEKQESEALNLKASIELRVNRVTVLERL